MNSTDWLAYFRQNKIDRFPIAWHERPRVCRHLRGPLARSLARFQLGESGEGARLLALARELAARTGDPDYAGAIALFIAEEQEHSRLLAKLLEQMCWPLLQRHWTDAWFRRCRHLLGYYEEISVLLTAEIIALKYYSAVRHGAEDALITRVCEQILHDEKFHVRFHCESLHRRLRRLPFPLRAGCGCALALLGAGATAVVAWDHRAALAALGCSRREFVWDCSKNFAAAHRAIFSGKPFAWTYPVESEHTGQPEAETLSALVKRLRRRLPPPRMHHL